MKKLKRTTTLLLILLTCTLACPPLTFSQSKQQVQEGVQKLPSSESTSQGEAASPPQTNQTQVQNRIQIQNQTEAVQLQTATRQMEQLRDSESFSKGTGEQVRTFAQEQVQAQTEIQGQLEKLETRPAWVKKIIGPDYGAIKNLKRQVEENQLRIEGLTQLQTQTVNKAGENQLQEAIQLLESQNAALRERLQAEEQAGSILGWLIRWFYR